jgi:hypothetical protein
VSLDIRRISQAVLIAAMGFRIVLYRTTELVKAIYNRVQLRIVALPTYSRNLCLREPPSFRHIGPSAPKQDILFARITPCGIHYHAGNSPI